jgi:hypothetical protein
MVVVHWGSGLWVNYFLKLNQKYNQKQFSAILSDFEKED